MRNTRARAREAGEADLERSGGLGKKPAWVSSLALRADKPYTLSRLAPARPDYLNGGRHESGMAF